MNLKGKTALITGAGRGIGREIAVKLASLGADVFLFSRTEQELIEVANELKAKGANVAFFAGDATKRSDVEKAVDEAIKQFGKIDILVNNVGAFPRKAFLEMSEDDWDYMINLNLKSAFYATKAVVPNMVARRYGRIINISSITGIIHGVPGLVHYGAAKAALIGFTSCSVPSFR